MALRDSAIYWYDLSNPSPVISIGTGNRIEQWSSDMIAPESFIASVHLSNLVKYKYTLNTMVGGWSGATVFTAV